MMESAEVARVEMVELLHVSVVDSLDYNNVGAR